MTPDGLDTSDEQPRKSPLRRAVETVVSVVVIAVMFVFVLPKLTGSEYGEVWDSLDALTAVEATLLVVVALLQIASYAPVLVSVLPGLGYTQAFVVNQASTAVSNVVPLGGALGVGVTYGMLASWGFGLTAITLSILVSGFWNLFMKLGFPVIGLALLAATGEVSAPVVAATAVGVGVLAGSIAVFSLVLKSERLAMWMGTVAGRFVSLFTRLVRRPAVVGWGDGAVRFRNESIDLVRTRWPWITISSVVFNLLLYVVLLMCIRAFGISESELSWVQVFAAFAFGRLLSTVPITPGGLGFVETGTLGLLTAGYDGSTAPIVAAVLLWRALTFFLPVPLGAMSYLVWSLNSSWRKDRADQVEPAGQ